MVLSHNLLVLTRVTTVVYKPGDVQRCPGHDRNADNLEDESPRDIAGVKVGLEQGNGHEVDHESHDRREDHLVVDLVNLREDVEDLAHDESAESDGDDVGEAVLVEHDDAAQHDHTRLEDGLPHPNQEGLCRENATLLQGTVEYRELNDRRLAAILISHQREHGEHRINRRVAEDQVAIVNGNGHKVEDDREDRLDDSDN